MQLSLNDWLETLASKEFLNEKLENLLLIFIYCRFLSTEIDPKLKLQRTLEKVSEIDAPLFISGSTCLGYLRNTDFLPDAEKVVIGVKASDFNRDLIAKIIDKGYILTTVTGTLHTGIIIDFVGQLCAPLCLTVYRDRRDFTEWISSDESAKIMHRKMGVFNLKEIVWYRVKINVPDPIEKYVQEYYGSTWRIPKKI